jgi:hypothetical protein
MNASHAWPAIVLASDDRLGKPLILAALPRRQQPAVCSARRLSQKPAIRRRQLMRASLLEWLRLRLRSLL